MYQLSIDLVVKYAPKYVFMNIINMNNRLKKRPVTVQKYTGSIFQLIEGNKSFYSCRRNRLWRYFNGIQKQCDHLASDYLLDIVPIKKDDLIIDCGANNGEIGTWANKNGLKYIAFEPEPLEAECCDLNNFDGRPETIRKGLWKEEGNLSWYSKPETADSSLIEINQTDQVTSIPTTTLSKYIHDKKIQNVKIFKLEAEGAEPEILQGSLDILDRIEYIAVDCGYERGIEKKHTFIEVYNILKENNFDIVAAEFKRTVFLFKNKNYS